MGGVRWPFTKGQSDDLSELRDMAYGWGKIVTRRAFGESGPGLDLDFDSIESLAVEMAQALTRGTVEEILKANFNCSATSSLVLNVRVLARSKKDPEPWPVRGGASTTTNRSVIARPVAGIFFPLRPSLRLDSHGFSPTVLGKIAAKPPKQLRSTPPPNPWPISPRSPSVAAS